MTPAPSSPAGPVRYFDGIAGAYARAAAHDPSFVERLRLFSDLIDRYRSPDRGDFAIDLGCGSGVIARRLAELGVRTVGIDGSEAMLNAARAVPVDGAALEFKQATLPLTESMVESLEGRASLVIASSVIEYIDEDRLFLEQCRQLLTPGGTALVSFANRRSIYRRGELLARHLLPLRAGVVRMQRWQHDESRARRLALDAGLLPESAHYYTLPAHRYSARLVHSRPAWLATLFVLAMRRPPN